MNEQIQQLAKQAGISILYEYDQLFRPAAVANLAGIEKFAELIVRECALTAAMFSINKNDIHPDIKWVDMTESAKLVNHTTCQQVAEKIKKHFGVK